jgi:thioredoxin-dependent peroxiredoxin
MSALVPLGTKMPTFSLPATGGELWSLAKDAPNGCVIFFYPKDNTPGCTREAIAFSAALDAFAALGLAVVGISKDTAASHEKFRAKHGLTIALLADPELTVHKMFGAFGSKSMYGKIVQGTLRSTFVLDAKRQVTHVFANVKVDGHAEAVLAAVQGHAAPRNGRRAKTPRAPAGSTLRPSGGNTAR